MSFALLLSFVTDTVVRVYPELFEFSSGNVRDYGVSGLGSDSSLVTG